MRGLGVVPLAVGGVEDHVHLLVRLKATHAVADLVREAKKASTSWARANTNARSFSWQEGYAGLSVGSDCRTKVAKYIARQEEHDQHISSKGELRQLLEEAGVEIDELYFE
jgi:putative transposase